MRVHPLSPLLRAWSAIAAVIIFALTAFSEKTLTLLGQFGDFAAGAYPESTWATVRIIVFALGVSVVAVALVFAFSLIW